MNIISCKNNVFKEDSFLYNALNINIDEKNIISFVGGGGKTTSIYTLAEELSSLGKKVIVTTTTHMHMPDDCIIYNGDKNIIINELRRRNSITVGIKDNDNKIMSIGENVGQELINICDTLLIEADGAKMLPLKAPAMHEPVILKESTMVVGVAGIDSLGKSIRDICHRPEIVKEVLGVDIKHKINTKDIACILGSKLGQRKNLHLCENVEYRVIINKADNEKLVEEAKKVAYLLAQCKITSVITTHYK